jgi:hypothetical protein
LEFELFLLRAKISRGRAVAIFIPLSPDFDPPPAL